MSGIFTECIAQPTERLAGMWHNSSAQKHHLSNPPQQSSTQVHHSKPLESTLLYITFSRHLTEHVQFLSNLDRPRVRAKVWACYAYEYYLMWRTQTACTKITEEMKVHQNFNNQKLKGLIWGGGDSNNKIKNSYE